jgi:preprotein translocase subunit SecF
VIRGFTFAMLFGVIVGTYSSVFIAAPFLILIGIKRDWSNVKAAPAKPTTRGRTARS